MGINRLDNETHLLQRNDPEKFVNLGIDPPKGVLCYGPPDAIGGARFDDGVGGDNEVQCTMLEIVNQLDGFDL
ncbi:hypothetical protein CsSME_00015934 [Camellia sinensis var. sinensis]